jgi:hypothetical protein
MIKNVVISPTLIARTQARLLNLLNSWWSFQTIGTTLFSVQLVVASRSGARKIITMQTVRIKMEEQSQLH